MAGRRLAVALPTNPPSQHRQLRPLNPPQRRDSPSLASMVSRDFVYRPRYRCCFQVMHLKTAAFLIGIADTMAISAAFGRGLHLGLSMQHNPMAIAWCVVSSLMFVLGFMCTLTMFYGIWRESYLWIIPKLVMKVSAVVLYSATTVGLVYMMMEHSQYLLDLVAEHVTKSDYESARFALRAGGGGLAVAFLFMALLHVWFFFILYKCYKYVKDRYFWLKTRLASSQSNDNHVAAVLASMPEQSPTTATISDPARPTGLSNIAYSNSSILGRNGNVQRSNTYNAPASSEFESLLMQNLAPRGQRNIAQCSCDSPILSNSSLDRGYLWKEFDQTNV